AAGTRRLRPGGSSGGQQGLQSLSIHHGTKGCPRLRLGIGRPPVPLTAAEYVLKPLEPEALAIYEDLARRAAEAAATWALEGTAAAMNKYNKANKVSGA